MITYETVVQCRGERVDPNINATGGSEDLAGGLGWPLFLEETARKGFAT